MTVFPTGALPVDANAKGVPQFGYFSQDPQNLTANATTAHVPIFTVTGTVLINCIYGVVTTALGNCTAAYWRLNDGSNTPAITLSTGTTLSSAAAGTTIVKKALAATALSILNNSASIVSEPAAAEGNYFSPFVVEQITAGTTNIEFTYTTSDAPTTGAIMFYVGWTPLSSNAAITPV